MEFKEYYQTLGVEKAATADEVKKAYRGLARKYHPDVSKEADASAKMAEINEAYAVLSDPEKRAAFDKLSQRRAAGGDRDFQPPPGWDAGFEFSGAAPSGENAGDFSDFFNTLFGHAARARRGGGQPHHRGADHHAKIIINLADAYHGATRPIALRAARLDETGHVVADERVLDVQIPKGVREGQSIRLRGQGSAGVGGAAAGDLYLEIHFEPDSAYRIEGRDVTQTVPVSPWEAALGAIIEVPTPSGRVEVNVPEGSANGRKLRLKGRGIPGDPAGDLYLELEVALPPADNAKARELYEAMARDLSSFNPRRNMKVTDDTR